jgi:hypothetical protein
MTFAKLFKTISRGLDFFLALAIVTFSKNASIIVIELDDAEQENKVDPVRKPDTGVIQYQVVR